ncbi:flagellin [Clostridium sp. 001]|uniref:flagellin N-terminal helical domain-containing protein n=1 Tax=Clostridium sp. 001 TaxID=1970093 RepID=UPI001C2B9DEB|nr:flagellin [Clostridium sp. 001]QXE20235.1 hypothetical protein B5S50_16110 [Clostridium sp. 001]
MIINHNLMANNAIRNMNINSGNASKSMQKLSSGLRINSAADDAAGLAISEKMRGQINGLDQASSNSQDGISMIQTAEGALNETTSILQRMKQLATQSANDTNVGDDRSQIQSEMNQLTSEINRIGNTTEFNTQKLLDGGASASGVKNSSTEATGVAAKGGEIKALNAIDIGNSAISNTNDSALTLTFLVTDNGSKAVTFTVNGASFKTLYDQTDAGKAGKDATNDMRRAAIQKVLGEISSSSAFTMPNGTNLSKVTLADVANITVSDDGKFSISSKVGGKDIEIYKTTSTQFGTLLGIAAGTTTVGKGTVQEEATIIGTKSIQGTDMLNRDDWAGKTFTVTYDGKTANITLGASIGTSSAGTISVTNLKAAFNTAFSSVFGSGAVAASIGTNPNNINDTKTYFKFKTTTAAADNAQGIAPDVEISGDNLNQLLGDFVPGSSAIGGTFKAVFQIGANMGQSFEMDVKDMRARALNISGTTAGGDQGIIDGAKFTSTKTVSNGTDNNNIESSLDISSHDTATAAIKVLDNAINAVSAQRSQLGAYQNRLEHTINNLGTSSENLTSAESRIRDVDMAKEMSNYSKNNILQQAAQAMLAQANQQPQQVLQLLR